MVVMMDIEISCKGHCEKLSLSRPCEPYWGREFHMKT